MSIIITQNGKNAHKLDKIPFGLESNLQQYIYDNPESIPLYDISEDIKLLILAREFPTNSGPIDAIGIDKNGDIYLVETKLYKNADKRTVLAQVLDYGASLWKNLNDFDEFLLKLNTSVQQKFNQSINDKLISYFNLNDDTLEQILDQMRQNLTHGNFKFVVLMDSLENRLKDLIMFVNQNSSFDIYGVELEYYKHNSYEIIIPKLYGAQVKKEVKNQSNTGSRKQWNETDFFNEISENLETKQIQSIKKLYDYSKTMADEISWGTGISKGSFSPKIFNISIRSIFSVFTDGTLQVNFGWLNDNDKTEKIRDKYGKLLKEIGLFTTKGELKTVWLKEPIENWQPHIDQFISVIDNIRQL